jgi:hypothetical protein
MRCWLRADRNQDYWTQFCRTVMSIKGLWW